eukprot:IDg22668t1
MTGVNKLYSRGIPCGTARHSRDRGPCALVCMCMSNATAPVRMHAGAQRRTERRNTRRQRRSAHRFNVPVSTTAAALGRQYRTGAQPYNAHAIYRVACLDALLPARAVRVARVLALVCASAPREWKLGEQAAAHRWRPDALRVDCTYCEIQSEATPVHVRLHSASATGGPRATLHGSVERRSLARSLAANRTLRKPSAQCARTCCTGAPDITPHPATVAPALPLQHRARPAASPLSTHSARTPRVFAARQPAVAFPSPCRTGHEGGSRYTQHLQRRPRTSPRASSSRPSQR